MKKRTGSILLSTIILFIFTSHFFAQNTELIKEEIAGYCTDLPFDMQVITVPSFPEKEFNILDFGAVGDGITSNTTAFQKAIDACSNSGGGKVMVPAGMWLTGPITLKSNVNLHLLQGAHIQFSGNFDEYPIVESTYEGYMQYRCTSPINAEGVENIAITGSGIIDGAGDAWRPVKKNKLTDGQWKELVAGGGVLDKSGKIWYPTENALRGSEFFQKIQFDTYSRDEAEKIRDFLRPVMVKIVNCKRVLLDGVTFQNSPAWNIHPLLCEDLIVRNINVRNPWYSQNGDGIDLESCRNSIVYNSKFDVGDDAICMKSGRDKYGRDRGVPSENIIIADCIVYHGHGGFTVGSEMSGGVRNIKITNCNFLGTDVGLRFKSTRGRGGVVENIFIEDIFMKDIPTTALSFNMYYGGQAPTEASSPEEESKSAIAVPVSEETPVFRKIYMSNIYCTGAEDAVILQGLPEMPISEIELNNINMTAEKGISIFDADNIKITNAKIYTQKSPAIQIVQSINVTLDKLDFVETTEKTIRLGGYKTNNIIIKNTFSEADTNKVELGNGVKESAVEIEQD